MIARAPGKVVVAGAYAVLDGFPALVAAVDRYAVADSERAAERVTEEVAAALDRLGGRAPAFDASALRAPGGDRKLGLGSSAAILCASLGARLLDEGVPERELAARVFPIALAAHRRAQGGGSGIDVAASAFGGWLRYQLGDGAPACEPWALPPDATVLVLAARAPASTPQMIARVNALRERDPECHRAAIARIAGAAGAALAADRAADLAQALAAQARALADLGRAAETPIVDAAHAELGELAEREAAAFGPAGAGGGDVSLFVGAAPPSAAFRARAAALGLEPLDVVLGARGLHRVVA